MIDCIRLWLLLILVTTGITSPCAEMAKVAVMVISSALFLIATLDQFLFACIDRPTGSYFVGVWSRLMTDIMK